MTKARDPSTFEDAIIRIVDRIGWGAAADTVGKSERVVRNWSDPDMDRQPTLDEALALDAAFLSAGGGAPPLMSVYSARLERAAAPAADSAQIAQAVGMAAREVGEAIAAGVAASLPGADRKTKVVAEKECDDGIAALQGLKLKLHVDDAVH